jgi:hypothetical protein
VVGGAGGGDDHLALALGQAAFTVHALGHHQGIVVGKKGTPFRRAAGKGQKHVGDEPGFFLHFQNAGADVFGQGVQVGKGVTGVHACLLSEC